eukprot:22971-Eustigmatos_ZCMA.PRE.1
MELQAHLPYKARTRNRGEEAVDARCDGALQLLHAPSGPLQFLRGIVSDFATPLELLGEPRPLSFG